MRHNDEGRIFTFYSYKGGTGRTMALANVAWILASNGKSVLTIDWDLEAPGLHRYFRPFLSDASFEQTEGLIDYLARYMIAATKEPPEKNKPDPHWYKKYSDIGRFATPVRWNFPVDGSIDLVGAGMQNSSYALRVNSFDWEGFYTKFGGGAFLDGAIRAMKESYDYVLIDSRTGISDTSGICTVHLPDDLVVLYTLNDQSIEGASGVAEDVARQRSGNGSNGAFRVFSLATRVELAEKTKLENRRALARTRFEDLLNTVTRLDDSQRNSYWGEMEVLYDPFYAYDEVLATVADTPGQVNSVLGAMERLTDHLTEGDVSRLGVMSDSKRREALLAFDNSTASAQRLPGVSKRKDKRWDVFISAASEDRGQAERLYTLLQTSYEVFFAPTSLQPGDRWEEALETAIMRSGTFVALFSRDTASKEKSYVNRELRLALQRQGEDPSFRIIPVQLDSDFQPEDSTWKELKMLQWLPVRQGDIQDAAAQLRKLLGKPRGDTLESEDQSARLGSELEQALAERSSLKETIEKLESNLKERSREKGVLEERAKQLQDRLDEQKDELEKETSRLKGAEKRFARTTRRLRIQVVALAVTAAVALGLCAFLFYQYGAAL